MVLVTVKRQTWSINSFNGMAEKQQKTYRTFFGNAIEEIRLGKELKG